MNPLRIERVSGDNAESIETIADLARRIWTEHYTPIIGEGQVEYMLDHFQDIEAITRQIDSDGYAYYIAYWDGLPAGYCSVLTDDDENSVFLSKIYVDADFRRKGVAREFIRRVLADTGYTRVWLTVNRNNIGSIEAYKKMGFEIAESLVTDIGGGYVMDDYKMVWRA
ncbi:MAG: GNAT family N-acetyltransferase [Clostridiales bacterium]|jgi:ribosomal protein S18 acetylase RimI-like enzyme|nr:GNAT family N-acetyltransferase [Clostridiales bacterium]